ncbi:MAG: stage II sporulation protein M [Vulcanibacillus sp.]
MISLFWITIKENIRNVKIASFIFLLGIVSGYIINPNNELIIASFEKLSELAEDIVKNESILYSITTIFVNNFKIALFMVVIGVIFGIFPIILLLFNGVFIGIFIKMFLEDGNSVIFLLIGLLPHGVFELTAIILAAAFGMKLGFTLFRTLINLFKGIETNDYTLRLSNLIKQTVVVLFGVAAILFVAAVIESTLSLYLIKNL